MNSIKKLFIVFSLVLTFLLALYFSVGVFVIQPIGMLPEGKTMVYWRLGTKMPFITSADGMLEKTGQDISLFGRAMALAAIVSQIGDKRIVDLPYSHNLYIISTCGKEYDR